MKTVNYTEARNGLARLMKETEEDREVIAITRNGEASVVLMMKEEYESMLETLHLLSTPANATRLQEGLVDYEAGRMAKHELCD